MGLKCSSWWKNTIWCISITSGRMKLILCSFVVLVSTSKPQNMSSKVHLVMELGYDIVDFTKILTVAYTVLTELFPPKLIGVSNFQRIDLPPELSESLRIFCRSWIDPCIRKEKYHCEQNPLHRDARKKFPFFPWNLTRIPNHLPGSSDFWDNFA